MRKDVMELMGIKEFTYADFVPIERNGYRSTLLPYGFKDFSEKAPVIHCQESLNNFLYADLEANHPDRDKVKYPSAQRYWEYCLIQILVLGYPDTAPLITAADEWQMALQVGRHVREARNRVKRIASRIIRNGMKPIPHYTKWEKIDD